MIDLSHLEQYRENNRIEAKKALGGLPHSIWETYSAFANTLGGIILLGVEEYKDKTLHTFDLPDPEKLVKEFWDMVNNPNKASVNILTNKHVRIEEVNGDRIIVIEVPRAQRYYKPVYVDGNPVSTSAPAAASPASFMSGSSRDGRSRRSRRASIPTGSFYRFRYRRGRQPEPDVSAEGVKTALKSGLLYTEHAIIE